MIKPFFVVTFALAVLLLFSYTPNSTSKVEASSVLPQEFENYDIRTDPSAGEKLKSLRNGQEIESYIYGSADVRIENNRELGIIESLTKTHGRMLTSTAGRTRAQTLKAFILDADWFGVASGDQLVESADYANPDGNLSFARFEQSISGIDVFGAEVTAGFTRKGHMFRVINSLARDLGSETVSSDFGSVEDAVIRAAGHIEIDVTPADLARLESPDGKIRFSTKAVIDPVDAERFYFPEGNGFVRPAWRVQLTSDRFAYYVVVDAEDGTLLWRKNVFHNQSVAATYNVYGNGTSPMKTADSPSPFSPGCTSPFTCPQPPAVARTNFALVGNEAPNTFNNLGWIPDTGLEVRTPANPNITDGNNVEAGIDRTAPTGIDDNGWAFGNPTRVFTYAYNPAPGMPAPGDEPLPPGPQPYPPTPFQQGVITQGFYLANRWHDEMYRIGFTEQARNFQHFNFGRGGTEGDRFMLELQDFSSTAGANSTILAEGSRPRTQMFVWAFPTPKRDGGLDSQMVVHELTHGTTSRVHGNITGLNSNMGRGMAEGWSDFYAISLLAESGDDRLGTHAFASYITYQVVPGYESNYYYGLRRFPYATW
ncbi:MAG TPA: M36 family metallopeptidase, partial [Pyrinomonadaceae bacterium]|nr:M36 family metallopeptidase [Pyrinomonadaceae bacterium]